MSEQILEQDKYKFGEVVLVDGQFEATIRDIFTRCVKTVDDDGEEIFNIYVSYRLHEKEWWYEEVLPHRIQKLGDKND